jgi:hypothetical protein
VFAAGFGGWWYASDAEVEGEHLTHALGGNAELLAGVGERESLGGAEAEDLAVALVWEADRSLGAGGSMRSCLLSSQMIS